MQWEEVSGKLTNIVVSIFITLILGALGVNKWVAEVLGKGGGEAAEVIVSNPPGNSSNEEIKRLTAEIERLRRAREEAAAEASLVEARKILADNRRLQMTQWKSAMLERARGEQVFDLVLKNKCHQKIYVAASYKDLNGTWVTRGWWSIDPFSEISPNIKTKNTYIYFYAYSPEGKYWSGEGKEGCSWEYTAREEFVTLYADDKLEGLEGVEQKPFVRVRMAGEGWQHTHSFSCD